LRAAAAKTKDYGVIGKPFSAASSADGAARAAASAVAADRSARPAALAAFSAARAADTVHGATDLWASIRTDAKHLAEGAALDAIALWPIDAYPLRPEWNGVRRRVQSQPDAEDWKFWIEWYDALLEGRPMLGDAGRTWEMLEKIALIDPETWDRGPGAVNPVIREIWELHRLRAEVAALHAEKAAFLAARASEAQRGHNQPPEGLVDDAPEVARQITIIWDGLDQARDALEEDAPDKGLLRTIAERMLAALNAVVAYCGKVADAVVMSTAKETGKLVARSVYVASLDLIVNNGRLMRFVKSLLAYAGGG
jgi:hypothetical protein